MNANNVFVAEYPCIAYLSSLNAAVSLVSQMLYVYNDMTGEMVGWLVARA